MPEMMDRLDRFQQQHTWAGFGFAVVQKFFDDQAGRLAALLAYYAFFSIFPLLLLLTTILGYVLAGDPALEHQVFSSALARFPIIGQHNALHPLTGNPTGLIIGFLVATWSGLQIAQTAQYAFNTVYAVPRVERGWIGPQLLRSAELVCVAGFGLLATTVLQGVLSGTGAYGLHIGSLGTALGALLGVVANTIVFVYVFRRASQENLTTRQVAPGALLAALVWFVLQKIGTGLVNTKIHGAQGTYGTFALVIGLLFWFFVLAQVTLLCAEINVVADRRLWPRGLAGLILAQSTTDADVRAQAEYSQRERMNFNVSIDTETHLDNADSTRQPPEHRRA
jgi:YihY family inner membrane protein